MFNYLKISILIPSRGRAEQLRKLIYNIFETARDPELVEVCILADADDVETNNMLAHENPDKVKFKIVPKGSIVFGDMWNHLLDISTGEIYMICGDDVQFRTLGWDISVRSEFDKCPDKIIYVFGDDGHQHGRLGVHGFVHKRWVETLGYITPKMFVLWYVDNWTDDIATRIGRRIYLRDVEIIHMHPDAGKAVDDKTYMEGRERMGREPQGQLYIDTASQREADAQKLRDVISLI